MSATQATIQILGDKDSHLDLPQWEAFLTYLKEKYGIHPYDANGLGNFVDIGVNDIADCEFGMPLSTEKLLYLINYKLENNELISFDIFYPKNDELEPIRVSANLQPENIEVLLTFLFTEESSVIKCPSYVTDLSIYLSFLVPSIRCALPSFFLECTQYIDR